MGPATTRQKISSERIEQGDAGRETGIIKDIIQCVFAIEKLAFSNRQMIFSGEIMFYGRVQMIRLIDDFHAILNENLLKGWTFLRSTWLMCLLQFRKQC